MKTTLMTAAAVFSLAVVPFLAGSCDMSGLPKDGEGELRLSFESLMDNEVRAVYEIPDTSDFLLTVKDASGNSIYDGKYGDCPEALKVPSGNYTVTANSIRFVKPAFDSPQYGDSQCVVVENGGVVNVSLACRQLNSGVRLSIDPAFLSRYPDGVLFLKSSDGKLMYSYSEKRTAYFNPGPVSLVLSRNSKDEVLMTRELEPREILVLGVSVSDADLSSVRRGIDIELDTTRNWINETFLIGASGSSGGASPDMALSVAQARAMGAAEDVWVSGYVVGGDLTASTASFEEPFKSKSNLLIGPRSATVDRSVCIAVQLQSGSLRDELNLVDNPSLLGRKVCLRGDVVNAYFGLTGLKNLKDGTY